MIETVKTESVFVKGAASRAIPMLILRSFAVPVSLDAVNMTLTIALTSVYFQPSPDAVEICAIAMMSFARRLTYAEIEDS
jgi:hypothetical protein